MTLYTEGLVLQLQTTEGLFLRFYIRGQKATLKTRKHLVFLLFLSFSLDS